ncbi:MAG: hypothetical protein EA411_09535 [Saprospirales bacterium]|nr:MAG: hypothetical protein EA411_09535 [Saprospirales bacterium]
MIDTHHLDFHFLNFKYFSDADRYLMHIPMSDPGLSGNHKHQVYLMDNQFDVVESMFKLTFNQPEREYNISNALKRVPNDGKHIYFAELLSGDIYKIDDQGSFELAFKVEDGIVNREDSLISIDPEFPDISDLWHNRKFYSILDYELGDSLIAINKVRKEGFRGNLIFSQESGQGLKFPGGIYGESEALHGKEFIFHFSSVDFFHDNGIASVIQPDLWNFVLEGVNDSLVSMNLFSHISQPATFPVLKIAVLKDVIVDSP